MRRIKLTKWKSRMPVMDDQGNPTNEIKMVDEDLLVAFNALIANKKPEDIPKGLDKFRLFRKITNAFEKAEKTRELVLEELEYKFLKETIESDVPSTWGMNKNLSEAIEAFMDAKEESVK